jgi:hypothetical protein
MLLTDNALIISRVKQRSSNSALIISRVKWPSLWRRHKLGHFTQLIFGERPEVARPTNKPTPAKEEQTSAA